MLQELFARATVAEASEILLPRTMLVFAHPDDEVIALGARLGEFRSALFVHVTDGAPRNERDSKAHGFKDLREYRRTREEELTRALHMAGLENAERVNLQIPDQEASLELPQLTRELRRLFLKHRSEVVFTHPYEGGHPDHDACAFAVHRAAALVAAGVKPPMIVEGAFYHAGPEGIETGCFLPHTEKTEETIYYLSPEERLLKKSLLACFSSQQETLQYFKTEREIFRIAPRYDFHQPPHAGPIFFDHYPWGMTSQRFCELTRAVEIMEEEAIATCQ